MLLVKMAKYVGFCVNRRSYLLWPPVVVGLQREQPLVKIYDKGLSEPQSRFGDKPVKFQAFCPQNGTAVLNGIMNAVPATKKMAKKCCKALRHTTPYQYIAERA